ncbi:MAG: nucleotide exchange factor GrpE [Candidatus Nomurabacteria bacterium]|nr:nucleotide exchange factor GrpE [Candidatus Nomurabacteria bacterium]
MSNDKNNMSDDQFDDVQFETTESELVTQKKGDKLKQIREKLKESQAEAKENLDGWQRARADYVNLQKSLDAERGQIRKRATLGLILDLLPSLDNFESAMKNREVWESVDANWRTGIEYIYQNLQRTLQENGVTEIQTTGQMDHELHEPLEVIETDNKKQDNEIAETVQKGYKMDGQIVRTARVKVYQFKKE